MFPAGSVLRDLTFSDDHKAGPCELGCTKLPIELTAEDHASLKGVMNNL